MIVYITKRRRRYTFPWGEGGRAQARSEEEWRDPKVSECLIQRVNWKVSARIPLQSPPNGGDSFPPGEAVGAAAPLLR